MFSFGVELQMLGPPHVSVPICLSTDLCLFLHHGGPSDLQPHRGISLLWPCYVTLNQSPTVTKGPNMLSCGLKSLTVGLEMILRAGLSERIPLRGAQQLGGLTPSLSAHLKPEPTTAFRRGQSVTVHGLCTFPSFKHTKMRVLDQSGSQWNMTPL